MYIIPIFCTLLFLLWGEPATGAIVGMGIWLSMFLTWLIFIRPFRTPRR